MESAATESNGISKPGPEVGRLLFWAGCTGLAAFPIRKWLGVGDGVCGVALGKVRAVSGFNRVLGSILLHSAPPSPLGV